MADLPSRFSRLERPRREAPAPAETKAGGRFGAVEIGSELPATAPSVPSSATDRFRAPREGELALEPLPEGQQPFVRCAVCEADSARHQERCERCGADLRTSEQRAFNERLWEARRREAELERSAAQAQGEARHRAAEDEARMKRAVAEAMAEEILARERARAGGQFGRRLLAFLGRLLSARVERF